MRVLVIGGTRFIGPHVVRQLAGMGHEVTVFHRGKTEADLPPQVEHVHSEQASIPMMHFPNALTDPVPDVVLHMIPIGERDARAVMSAFTGRARRIVAISSGDVYRSYGVLHRTEPGPLEPLPITEETPLRQVLYPNRGETPRSEDDPNRWDDEYDKILVERALMSEPTLPGTVLRLPFVYGPNDGGRLTGYIKRMDDGRPAILLERGMAGFRGTWGYVENVAAAIVLAVIDERATGRIYNVGEPDAPPMADWVRTVGRVAGWNGDVIEVARDRLPEHLTWGDCNWDQHWVMDTTRIRWELGYEEPIPRDEALRRTINWERANPPQEIDPQRFDYPAEDGVLAKLSRSGD